MRRMSPRQAKRLMSQMGMRIEELDNVQQVIIRTPKKEVIQHLVRPDPQEQDQGQDGDRFQEFHCVDSPPRAGERN